MAQFTATLTMPGLDYTKTATMDDAAVALLIGSMRRRLSVNHAGQVQDANADGSPKVDPETGQPVMRDMTGEEAINLALAEWINGWGQAAREDAVEAASAAARAAIPDVPTFTVL